MAILGVLLGITMCGLAWAINESREHRKLIIELQNKVIFDLQSRVVALEKRRAFVPEPTVGQPVPVKVAPVKLRTWNEDAPASEAITR